MPPLTKQIVLCRTRQSDLRYVKVLNCFSQELTDVSVIKQMCNLETLGLTCNEITTLEPFAYCKKLKELHLRSNKIEEISEIEYLKNLPMLGNLTLSENPICKKFGSKYRLLVLRALPHLTKLDNVDVASTEVEEAIRGDGGMNVVHEKDERLPRYPEKQHQLQREKHCQQQQEKSHREYTPVSYCSVNHSERLALRRGYSKSAMNINNQSDCQSYPRVPHSSRGLVERRENSPYGKSEGATYRSNCHSYAPVRHSRTNFRGHLEPRGSSPYNKAERCDLRWKKSKSSTNVTCESHCSAFPRVSNSQTNFRGYVDPQDHNKYGNSHNRNLCRRQVNVNGPLLSDMIALINQANFPTLEAAVELACERLKRLSRE